MAKELFDRTVNEDPAWTRRLAHGAPSELAENMTMNGILTKLNGGIVRKVISIGTWNMTTGDSKSVAHGLTFAKIVGFDCIIEHDSTSAKYKIDRWDDVNGKSMGEVRVGASNIDLYVYESWGSGFSGTSKSRGYVIIDYIL